MVPELKACFSLVFKGFLKICLAPMQERRWRADPVAEPVCVFVCFSKPFEHSRITVLGLAGGIFLPSQKPLFLYGFDMFLS